MQNALTGSTGDLKQLCLSIMLWIPFRIPSRLKSTYGTKSILLRTTALTAVKMPGYLKVYHLLPGHLQRLPEALRPVEIQQGRSGFQHSHEGGDLSR